ncbi:MAG: hypothetical protein HQL53_03250 [Magnetococcales bacterium]|nr:hypothetical protein [Magnetococcales bacterium]
MRLRWSYMAALCVGFALGLPGSPLQAQTDWFAAAPQNGGRSAVHGQSWSSSPGYQPYAVGSWHAPSWTAQSQAQPPSQSGAAVQQANEGQQRWRWYGDHYLRKGREEAVFGPQGAAESTRPWGGELPGMPDARYAQEEGRMLPSARSWHGAPGAYPAYGRGGGDAPSQFRSGSWNDPRQERMGKGYQSQPYDARGFPGYGRSRWSQNGRNTPYEPTPYGTPPLRPRYTPYDPGRGHLRPPSMRHGGSKGTERTNQSGGPDYRDDGRNGGRNSAAGKAISPRPPWSTPARAEDRYRGWWGGAPGGAYGPSGPRW